MTFSLALGDCETKEQRMDQIWGGVSKRLERELSSVTNTGDLISAGVIAAENPSVASQFLPVPLPIVGAQE